MLPRFGPSATARRSPARDLIAKNLDALFPGMEMVDHAVFRVTRDADFTSPTSRRLCRAVEDELRRRRPARSSASMSRLDERREREQIVSSLDAEEETLRGPGCSTSRTSGTS